MDENIVKSVSFIKSVVDVKARTAFVLGTGLQRLSDFLSEKVEIEYKDIPHFPTSTVKSHTGKLLIGNVEGKQIVLVSGRFHYYEGYSTKEATYYIHVLNALGIKNVFLTNASGGLNPHYNAGDVVFINDHINLFPENPLRGPNDENLGPRFPDMMHTYDKELIETCVNIGKQNDIECKEGVYLGWQGPSLETPAEYRMARILGADLVGMSTVPEVIVAKYYGMRICAVSIVSNVCFPLSKLTETTIDEVINTVNKAADKLVRLFSAYFRQIKTP